MKQTRIKHFVLSTSYLLLTTIFILVLSTSYLLLTTKNKPSVLSAESDVTQNVTIGGALVEYSLFGYTSSGATVKLEGIGASNETKADNVGYFEINHFLAPVSTSEFCLTTIDTEKLISPPLCVPVPPTTDNRKYGPFLLPPTIRLANGNINTGEQATVTGKTIPGTSVDVAVFNVNNTNMISRILRFTQDDIIKSAYAVSPALHVTRYTLQSAPDGTYTTSLTPDKDGKVRLFAQSKYSGQKTPKSFTLTLTIFSAWLGFFVVILNALKNLITVNTIILIQLLILVFLLLKRIKWHTLNVRRQRQIQLYRSELPMKAINYCSLYERHHTI